MTAPQGDAAEVLATRALQLHYALVLARRHEAARLRSAARTLHACANRVVALHTDVCRLRRRAARARRAQRFRAAHARLLQLAATPTTVTHAAAHAARAADALDRATTLVPCAEGLAAGFTPPSTDVEGRAGAQTDAAAQQRFAEALRDLADSVARATAAARALDVAEGPARAQRRTLEALRARQAFLEACCALGLDHAPM